MFDTASIKGGDAVYTCPNYPCQFDYVDSGGGGGGGGWYGGGGSCAFGAGGGSSMFMSPNYIPPVGSPPPIFSVDTNTEVNGQLSLTYDICPLKVSKTPFTPVGGFLGNKKDGVCLGPIGNNDKHCHSFRFF